MISLARGLSGTTRKRPFLGVHFLPPTRRERVCSSTRMAPSRFGPSDVSTECQMSRNSSSLRRPVSTASSIASGSNGATSSNAGAIASFMIAFSSVSLGGTMGRASYSGSSSTRGCSASSPSLKARVQRGAQDGQGLVDRDVGDALHPRPARLAIFAERERRRRILEPLLRVPVGCSSRTRPPWTPCAGAGSAPRTDPGAPS